ncbi:unnamed protein product [Heligmosomoides polygyrus]|uniref:C2H2-type domain-containing protein n=1 Tax=Heligmosomoides polygyrus TaxID=6339 RepID=A0A3P7ZE96_HELPZ|nr:unnamed protein product [Heligmosomoides polygyrus]
MILGDCAAVAAGEGAEEPRAERSFAAVVGKTAASAEAQDSTLEKGDSVPGAVKQSGKQSTSGNVQLVLGIRPAPAVEVDVEKTPNNFHNQYEDQHPWAKYVTDRPSFGSVNEESVTSEQNVNVYKHLGQGGYFATRFVRTLFPRLFVGAPSTNNKVPVLELMRLCDAIALRQQADRVIEDLLNHHYEDDTVEFPRMSSGPVPTRVIPANPEDCLLPLHVYRLSETEEKWIADREGRFMNYCRDPAEARQRMSKVFGAACAALSASKLANDDKSTRFIDAMVPSLTAFPVRLEFQLQDTSSENGWTIHRPVDVFFRNSTLVIHNATQIPPVSCPGCPGAFNTRVELSRHCMDQHSSVADFTVVEEEFSSFQCFENWKSEKERNTLTRFIMLRSRSSRLGLTTTEYACHRSYPLSHSSPATEEKKRFRKMIRTTSTCPSFLKLKQYADGRLKVMACFGHYGHEVASSSLPIPLSDELQIKNMLQSGVPPKKVPILEHIDILSNMNETRWKADQPLQHQDRVCFASMKDISNIVHRHGLIDGRTSNNDLESLRNLLNDEAKDFAAVCFEESKDMKGIGFVLVVDDTFNVTRYPFRLATLLVSDNAGNGFPCGHLLSRKMTSVEVQKLFKLLKDLMPDFDTEFFITDDTNVFYNAFSAMFPSSKTSKLLCSFHIAQTMKRRHKELLQGSNASLADKLFRRLLYETTVPQFESYFSSYLSWLVSIEAFEMVESLRQNATHRQIRNHKHHRDALTHYKGYEGLIEELGEWEWSISSKTNPGLHYTVTIDSLPCRCEDRIAFRGCARMLDFGGGVSSARVSRGPVAGELVRLA